jgi:tRNA(Arg) A34 adenosine deaminase TadA
MRYQITAILFDKKGRPLSVGRNSYTKTHPLMARESAKHGEPYKVFLHAEIDAIVRCRDMDKAHRIVVMRFDANGLPVNAKPCIICQGLLSTYNLRIEHT